MKPPEFCSVYRFFTGAGWPKLSIRVSFIRHVLLNIRGLWGTGKGGCSETGLAIHDLQLLYFSCLPS